MAEFRGLALSAVLEVAASDALKLWCTGKIHAGRCTLVWRFVVYVGWRDEPAGTIAACPVTEVPMHQRLAGTPPLDVGFDQAGIAGIAGQPGLWLQSPCQLVCEEDLCEFALKMSTYAGSSSIQEAGCVTAGQRGCVPESRLPRGCSSSHSSSCPDPGTGLRD